MSTVAHDPAGRVKDRVSLENLPKDPVQCRKELLRRLNTPMRFIYDASNESDRRLCKDLSRQHHDVIIAGAGPGGVQAAVALSNRGFHCLLLEKDLFIDSNNTIALPDTIIESRGLERCVAAKHKDTKFTDYFGLRYPAQLGYCILDQTKTLATLASRIDPEYCRVIENCEARSCARRWYSVKIKTLVNGYKLMPYSEASQHFLRAVSLLQVNEHMFSRHNPFVKVNTWAESEMGVPEELNLHFRGKILVEAAGYLSNISNSLSRSSHTNVWKCLVWEFEHVYPSQQETIWDMSVPTQSHLNFWIDVSGMFEAAAGVMVLTETSPTSPEAYPSKRDLEEELIKWLGRRSLKGKMLRERYGFIPMTDFREPAAYDNVIFIGLSAVRQIPNTGFGFFPAMDEADLAADTIERSLKKAEKAGSVAKKIRCLNDRALRRYDLAWLRQRELSMALDLIFQDLHFAAKTDETFHEFARKSTDMSEKIVKRRILALMGPGDILAFTKLFLQNPYLLNRQRYKPEYRKLIVRDIGRVIYCLFSKIFFFYCPEGSEMFQASGPSGSYPARVIKSIDVLLRRRIPEAICILLANVLFIEALHIALTIPQQTIRLICRCRSVFLLKIVKECERQKVYASKGGELGNGV